MALAGIDIILSVHLLIIHEIHILAGISKVRQMAGQVSDTFSFWHALENRQDKSCFYSPGEGNRRAVSAHWPPILRLGERSSRSMAHLLLLTVILTALGGGFASTWVHMSPNQPKSLSQVYFKTFKIRDP